MQTLSHTDSVFDAHTAGRTFQPHVLSTWGMRLVGLGIVALVPAAFWTAMLAWIGPMVGITVTASLTAATFAAIAFFLSCVFAAMVSSKRQYA